MKTIAILGECMIELNGQPFSYMHQTYGGDSLNVAIYLARMSTIDNLCIKYVTVMGLDPLSLEIVERWKLAGIDTSLVLEDEIRHPGIYIIQLDEQGERNFLY